MKKILAEMVVIVDGKYHDHMTPGKSRDLLDAIRKQDQETADGTIITSKYEQYVDDPLVYDIEREGILFMVFATATATPDELASRAASWTARGAAKGAKPARRLGSSERSSTRSTKTSEPRAEIPAAAKNTETKVPVASSSA